MSRIRAETAMMIIITAPAPAHAASMRTPVLQRAARSKAEERGDRKNREGNTQAGAGADTKNIRAGKGIAEEGLHQQSAD